MKSLWEQWKTKIEEGMGGASIANVRFSPRGELELYNTATKQSILLRLTPEQLETLSNQWYSFVNR